MIPSVKPCLFSNLYPPKTMSDQNQPLAFDDYRRYAARFVVDHERVSQVIAACTPLAIEALSVYGLQHVWRGELPVYPVTTTPEDNGGWGHLMPVWFKPYERPVPVYALNDWALFALVYAGSFGPSDEARRLVEQAFTADNLARVVVGTNLLIPFLPTTQGKGVFLRHGMLPFLLSILWLEEDARRAWLRLHELGAARFIATSGLAGHVDPVATLEELEFLIFARIERNNITSDEEVAAFLASDPVGPSGIPSLLSLYQDLFGAIDLGITALAAHYQKKSLDAWRTWFPQEIGVSYRTSDYAVQAVHAILQRNNVSTVE
jgi:hypothetical protein